jgi:hypothetical protein
MDARVRPHADSSGGALATETRLAAVKAAVLDCGTYAAGLQAEGRLDAVEGLYTALLLTIRHLLYAEGTPRGWQRAAVLASDLRTRQMLDALGPTRLDELQLRAAVLLDLPAIATVDSFDQIAAVIANAINTGAPRYNAGDVIGCCVVYWGTVQTLVAAPATRGFPNYARALGQLRAVADAEPPLYPLDATAIDNYAWALRQAFDAVLAIEP